MKGVFGITRDLRAAAVTYSKAVRAFDIAGVHYALLECGHTTTGSKVNQPAVGQGVYCHTCTERKLRKTGDA